MTSVDLIVDKAFVDTIDIAFVDKVTVVVSQALDMTSADRTFVDSMVVDMAIVVYLALDMTSVDLMVNMAIDSLIWQVMDMSFAFVSLEMLTIYMALVGILEQVIVVYLALDRTFVDFVVVHKSSVDHHHIRLDLWDKIHPLTLVVDLMVDTVVVVVLFDSSLLKCKILDNSLEQL